MGILVSKGQGWDLRARRSFWTREMADFRWVLRFEVCWRFRREDSWRAVAEEDSAWSWSWVKVRSVWACSWVWNWVVWSVM